MKVGGREEIGNAQLLFDCDSFRETLTTLQENKNAKRWVPRAKEALETLELQGQVEFDAILAEGIRRVTELVGK